MGRKRRSESYGRKGGRSHYGGETRERGKRDGGEEGPKGRKKTLKSGRNCRRRSSFNNALLRQKRGGNDSGEGRRSPTFPLDSRHHRNSDRRPTWRSPEVEMGWDRGEMEGPSLSPSLDLACLSVIGGLGETTEEGRQQGKASLPTLDREHQAKLRG